VLTTVYMERPVIVPMAAPVGALGAVRSPGRLDPKHRQNWALAASGIVDAFGVSTARSARHLGSPPT
jgi:hypothetical protein